MNQKLCTRVISGAHVRFESIDVIFLWGDEKVLEFVNHIIVSSLFNGTRYAYTNLDQSGARTLAEEVEYK